MNSIDVFVRASARPVCAGSIYRPVNVLVPVKKKKKKNVAGTTYRLKLTSLCLTCSVKTLCTALGVQKQEEALLVLAKQDRFRSGFKRINEGSLSY